MDFRKKIRDIVTLGSANIAAAIILGFFWLFLATYIEKIEYGELGYYMSIVNVGLAISMLGLRGTVVVYEAKNENIFPASFIIVLISSSITSVVSYFLTHNVAVSMLIIGMTIFFIIVSGLNSKFRYMDISLHVIIRAVIAVLLALIFYQVYGINGILFGFFLASFLILKELSSLVKNKEINFSLLKSKIKFTLHIWSNRLAAVLFWWGDKIIIGYIFGFSILASYHLAVQYVLLIDTIPRSISQYLLPQESSGKKNKQIKIFSIIISSIIAIISIISIPYIIDYFLSEYHNSILPMQIMSIAIIPLAIAMIQQSEFLGKENSRIVLLGSIIQTGFYFPLLIVLGQLLEVVGFAIGFLASIIIRVIVNLIMKKYLQE